MPPFGFATSESAQENLSWRLLETISWPAVQVLDWSVGAMVNFTGGGDLRSDSLALGSLSPQPSQPENLKKSQVSCA